MRITIYGQPEVVQQFQRVTESYPALWKDQGNAVDVPESEWLRIPLIDDWQSKHKLSTKVYLLNQKDREIVDQTFDKLYGQEHIEWTPQGTPFVLVKKRPGTYKGGPIIEYLVWWKGYGPAYDEWIPEPLLGNAKKLVEEFEKRNKSAKAGKLKSRTGRRRANKT
ncbi:MAG: hypothetical protein M1816_003922 [Peltula sp. TS41687]|nr:MAG: hypothetical protein M1816_003922 [Peltula sp. TS41687]